jgi:hypothetical protein
MCARVAAKTRQACDPQYKPDFYVAYVRDPDGNRLAAGCRGFVAPQARHG